MGETEPRRRASDFAPKTRTLGQWLADNITLALIISAILGLGGLLITGTAWYISVNGLGGKIEEIKSMDGLGGRVAKVEPKVTLLEAKVATAEATLARMEKDIVSVDQRLNDMRKRLDDAQRTADDVRRTLDAADSHAAEALARLDERQKASEAHYAPLPFNPPGKPPR
jgi:TolA-binding protein